MQCPDEGRIVGEFEAPPAMRGQAVRFPDFLVGRRNRAGGFGDHPCPLVGHVMGRRLQRHHHKCRGRLAPRCTQPHDPGEPDRFLSSIVFQTTTVGLVQGDRYPNAHAMGPAHKPTLPDPNTGLLRLDQNPLDIGPTGKIFPPYNRHLPNRIGRRARVASRISGNHLVVFKNSADLFPAVNPLSDSCWMGSELRHRDGLFRDQSHHRDVSQPPMHDIREIFAIRLLT